MSAFEHRVYGIGRFIYTETERFICLKWWIPNPYKPELNKPYSLCVNLRLYDTDTLCSIPDVGKDGDYFYLFIPYPETCIQYPANRSIALVVLTYIWVDRIRRRVKSSIDKLVSQISGSLGKFGYVRHITGFWDGWYFHILVDYLRNYQDEPPGCSDVSRD